MPKPQRISGIYKITCTQTRKFYIGSAVYVKSRWALHRMKLRKNIHDNKHLQRAFNKHGEQSFIFEIIESCPKDILIEREQHYIDTLKPKFNIARIAGNTLGCKHTEEVKQFLRNKFKGRTPSNKGVPHKESTKELLRQAWIRRKATPKDQIKENERRLKISKSLKGKLKSEEHKNNLKGIPMPQHVRDILYVANVGRKHTQASIEKMSAAQKVEITKRKRDSFGRILPKTSLA